jgi:hypothetical protein
MCSGGLSGCFECRGDDLQTGVTHVLMDADQADKTGTIERASIYARHSLLNRLSHPLHESTTRRPTQQQYNMSFRSRET